MDTKILIEKLNKIFCNKNKSGNKYLEIWLTEADLGGIYKNGKYILNVKAEHEIPSCFDEIGNILDLLEREAKEESKFIWSVNVYDPSDRIHCEGEEMLILDESNACV